MGGWVWMRRGWRWGWARRTAALCQVAEGVEVPEDVAVGVAQRLGRNRPAPAAGAAALPEPDLCRRRVLLEPGLCKRIGSAFVAVAGEVGASAATVLVVREGIEQREQLLLPPQRLLQTTVLSRSQAGRTAIGSSSCRPIGCCGWLRLGGPKSLSGPMSFGRWCLGVSLQTSSIIAERCWNMDSSSAPLRAWNAAGWSSCAKSAHASAQANGPV